MMAVVTENEYLKCRHDMNMRVANWCKWKTAGEEILDEAICNLSLSEPDLFAVAEWILALRTRDNDLTKKIPSAWRRALQIALFSYPGEECLKDSEFEEHCIIKTIINTKSRLFGS